ncbi:MAG: response regulator [Candidatus Obscuribacterales bacterium]|nr:response regulator [Candidatus Obscuribacterales bacterium]
MLFSPPLKAKEESSSPATYTRSEYLFDQQRHAIYVRTDKMFGWLFILQWIGSAIAALLISPYTWEGTQHSIHIHVWQAIVLGGIVNSLPLFLVWKQPGTLLTRQTIAIAQMLWSGLIIAISGGRIETHFHVFGSLAFLAFYRDWRVLLTASAITALDHFLRGIYAPASIYGVQVAEPWRWFEHSTWVVFCDFFLIISIRHSLRDMRLMAHRQAELESAKNYVEQEVVARTAELKLSEQNLRDSEATIRAIFETAADSIITIAENGTIETANQTCEKMYGYQFHTIFGKHISFLIKQIGDELCTEDSWVKWRDMCRVRRNALRLEGIGLARGRVEIPIEISLSFVNLKGKKLITAIVRDISERKEAERRVSEFYSIVSHELRTPLTSIRGSLGLIEGGMTGDLPVETLELVNIARESCDRLIRLINDILDLKKLEAGKFEFHKMEITPSELLGMSLAFTEGMARERGIRLELGWTTEQPIIADTDRLNQGLVNLISNAIKFSPKAGVVELSATIADNAVRFVVRDQGKGISKDQQHKLFCKFQQVDSSDKREQEGTGLGLAICKAIVEQHGGQIGVESDSDKGASFWFTIPVVSGEFYKPTEDEGRTSYVVVIDDASKLGDLLNRHLLPSRCQLVHVHDSDEASKVIAERVPDLVIFNVSQPDEADLELQEQLRSLYAVHNKPVVLFTHSTSDADAPSPVRVEWHKRPVKEEIVVRDIKRAVDSSNCPTVLVVEDDPGTRKTLVHQLGKYGIRCLEASGGEEGLNILATENPELIVLDVGLPDMNGFDFVKRLREEPSCKALPLLVYTGRDLTAAERRDLTIGFTRYLTKSKASELELVSAIDELLEKVRIEVEAKANS